MSGTGGFQTSQVTVDTTSGGKLIAARYPGRNAITITNLGTTDIYIGNSGVTTATGTLLPGVKGASLTIPTQDAVYGIVGSSSQAVSTLETF